MLCCKFKTIMSTNACIKRQEWAINLKVHLILESKTKANDHSLITCLSCTQGKAVKENPNKFIDRDFLILKEKHLQIIRKRGWIFKEPVSYDSLFDTFNYTKIENKPKRENTNERSGIFTKSRAERITRFIRKHRGITRDKQNISKPIRTELNTKSGFQLGFTKNRRSRRNNTSHC